MKFRLVELNDNGTVIKVYYVSPNVFNELKKKCIKIYVAELNFQDIFSTRKFEIQKTKDNVLWKRHSNPIKDYYNLK